MKVFLGGTCNESTWRDSFTKMLNPEVKYFDPVVKDWTATCMAEEIRQRGICDFVLYVITPRISGFYSIAEVVDDSHKRPEKTIFVRTKDPDGSEFTTGQWKSLRSVARMVESNGAKSFCSLEDAAEYINNVLATRHCSDVSCK